MKDTNRSRAIQAPPSLLAQVETRLQTYRAYIADAKTLQDCVTALQHPEWEVRSAAADALGLYDPQNALEPLLQALSDENCFVRMAAIHALGRIHGEIPVDRLLFCLQDNDWQVRESAALTLGKLYSFEIRQHLEQARSDSSREVRDAADLALQTHNLFAQTRESVSSPKDVQQVASFHHRKERKSHFMDGTRLLTEPADQQANMASLKSLTARPLWKRQTQQKVFFLVATVIILVTLTAAGVAYSWWNTTFGNPDLYQTIQQQQTYHGVTVIVTKVYADEGRTVIAYDTFAADHAQNLQFFVDDDTVQGSVPAKQEALQGTFGDPMEQGVTHYYMLAPAFEVPAGMDSVRITWDIGRMLVVQAGKGKLPDVSGHWYFSFTVPFHHENNQNLPDPIHGERISR